MADRRNQRHPRFHNGPCHGFLVEGPEVFERTSASRYDDHLDVAVPVEIFDTVRDLPCRTFSLHPDGVKQDIDVLKPASKNTHDIINYRARR